MGAVYQWHIGGKAWLTQRQCYLSDLLRNHSAFEERPKQYQKTKQRWQVMRQTGGGGGFNRGIGRE